jgi:hypothetical protein
VGGEIFGITLALAAPVVAGCAEVAVDAAMAPGLVTPIADAMVTAAIASLMILLLSILLSRWLNSVSRPPRERLAIPSFSRADRN